MRLFHENPIFETVKLKVIISLFETVRFSVSILPRNLYNSLKSIKESFLCDGQGTVRQAVLSVNRPRGYKTFFVLNSTEHKIFPTHKC